MATQISFRGQQTDKWVAIACLKDEGWEQTRCAVGDILYRDNGNQLTVVRIKDWTEKNWDGPVSDDTKQNAIWLAEDEDIDWQ